MIRSALVLSLALLGVTAFEASAAEVEVAYKGVVTRSSGPHASSFAPGQKIDLRYIVETTTADNNPDVSKGVFFNGLRRLEIVIPAAGVSTATDAGTVQTFNDVGSDQVFFYGAATQGQLAGLSITQAEVDFVDYSSSMINNDSIPTDHLVTTDSFAILYTSAGYTFVNFLVEPDIEQPAATCASEGYKGAQLTWCKNICENGLTGQVLDTWIHRWVSRYRQLPYCAVDGSSNPS